MKRYFLAILIAAFLAPALSGQDFGRNKVRYEDFDFTVLETDSFDLLFPQDLREAAERSGRALERWNARFRRLFDHSLSSRQPVILYGNHPDFQQTNVIPGLISQGIGGVTEGRQGRIVLPLSATNRANDHVLGHELVHGFHFDMIDALAGGLGFVADIPLWFVEGIAEYATLGAEDSQTAMWLRDAAAGEGLPTIREMSRNPDYNPYRFGHALWAYIGMEYGDDEIADLYKSTIRNGFPRAVENVLGVTQRELSEQWHADMEKVLDPELRRRSSPESFGTEVLPDTEGLTISPSLDPRGRYVAFFSQPNVFSLELTLADLRSGEILGRLSTRGRSGHFDQLRFTASSGAFSPEGDRFAFVIQRQGDTGIGIASVPELGIRNTLLPDELGEVSDIAWYPSGDSLLLAASRGGVSNLYRLELASGAVEEVTTGGYSAIQPTIGPEGEWIAYVTDRGDDTDLGTQDYGAMKIALRRNGAPPESPPDRLVALPGAETHINPQFSADGESLYFVADPDGVANIYRFSLDSDRARLLSNLQTGVSGFTDLAPALSVAGPEDSAAFTVFHEQSYQLRRLDLRERQGAAVSEPAPTRAGARLTAPGLLDFIVSRYLADPERGLPGGAEGEANFSTRDYRPQLRLTSVSQAALGVSFSSFGAGLYGTVNLNFADLLNNNLVSLYLQLGGSTLDLGGQLSYFNRDRRLGWGAALSHTPYRSISREEREETVTVGEGQDEEEVQATILEETVDRTFLDRAQLLGEYPLSRNLRFEGVAGYSRLSFLEEIRTVAFAEGEQLYENTRRRTPDPPLHLGQGGLAFVGDYSSFGFTGPLEGSRFRLQGSASAGSLTVVNSRADARQYVFLRPLSLAFRGLYEGQYLERDPQDLIGPLDLGSSYAVRGYYPGSYSSAECAADAERCPEYDRIFGSQLVAAKAELRLPLLGTEQLGLLPFRYLPTTLFAFADAGVAWAPGDPPRWEWSRSSNARIPVASVGGGVRFNLLGAFVLQVYYAYPFQRPESDGYLNIVLAPGF